MTLRGLDALAALINKPKTTARIERSVQLLMRYPSLRWLSLGLAMVAAVLVMTTPFNWFGQLLFFIFAWALSLVVRRLPGRFPSLALAAISLLATGRYAWWRVTTTLEFETLAQAVLGYGLLAAEAYTWLVVVLGFGVAVNDRRKNQQTGEWEDYPNFIDCTMFGARAESLSRYLGKGTKVAIEGKLRWSQWEREGQKRSKIEVIVDELEFMSSRNKTDGYDANAEFAAIPSSLSPDSTASVYDEDIPF